MDILHNVTANQMKTDLPDFAPGDSISVNVKVIEGNKERIQTFSGI
ncbi:MAG: 50S ribosomal protein L19, partial [Calditrichota bacterium]